MTSSLVGLFDNGPTLLAPTFNHGIAVDLGRLDQAFGSEARIVVDLRGTVFGLGQHRSGALLGLDEMVGRAFLALGEEEGRALLSLGGNATRLFVGRAQDRGALRSQSTREGRLVKSRIRRAPQGLGELFLQVANATFEVADFT